MPRHLAAGAFACAAAAQFLGAFATYDAMALCMLAMATWLGVQAAARRPVASAALIAAAAVALTAANATKYASALFDPIVIMVVVCAAWQARRLRAGGCRCRASRHHGRVAGHDVLDRGAPYAAGIAATTLRRPTSTTPAPAVWIDSGLWAGIVVGLALTGAIFAPLRRTSWQAKVTACTLAAAGFLAPAEQARIHTAISLYKHVGYGAWFSAVLVGGFLAGRPRSLARPAAGRMSGGLQVARLTIGIVAVVGVGVTGVIATSHHFRGWQNADANVAALRALETPTGRYLVEDPTVPSYYLRTSSSWQQWHNTEYLNYPERGGKQLTGPDAYAAAIKNRYFSVIDLAFGDTASSDEMIVADIERYNTYRLAKIIPFTVFGGLGEFEIWVPSTPHRRALVAVTRDRSPSRRAVMSGYSVLVSGSTRR